jgi:hypothetical protein
MPRKNDNTKFDELIYISSIIFIYIFLFKDYCVFINIGVINRFRNWVYFFFPLPSSFPSGINNGKKGNRKEMNYLINVYDAVNKPTVTNTIDVFEWFKSIKTPTKRTFELIDTTRNYYPKGSGQYDYAKKQLPAVTYNFLFDGYKKDDNIKNSTGLLFIDVDKPEFDISILNTGHTFSYYKSFGGSGYHILVKATNVTKENFNEYYKQVCKELNIEKYVDTDAIKKTQFSITSYDPNIFINNDAQPFLYKEEKQIASNPMYITKKGEHLHGIGGKKYNDVRYSNLEEIKETLNFENPYYTDWDGIDVIECRIKSNKIKEGKRKSSLFAYCTNFVILNEQLDEMELINVLMKVNNSMCNIPLNYKEVKDIVTTVLKYKKDGTLTPIYTKRKIVFEGNNQYNKEEKLEIVGSLINEHRKEQSKEKLYSIIENWNFDINGKISVRSITKNSNMNIKTISKYYPEFKEYINELNKNNFSSN